MGNYDYYFGHPDAGAAESSKELEDTYLPRKVDDLIKVRGRESGKTIIVGIKGSGKTAIRRHIEAKDPEAVVWNLDVDNSYMDVDASKIKAKSGIIKNFISIELLRAFSREVVANDSAEVVKNLRSVSEKALDVFKNIPGALEIKGPLAKVNVGELLRPGKNSFLSATWKETLRDVLNALGNKRAYILIDDAEDVFQNLEESPLFIEGLARSVDQINRESKTSLHVLVFLKYGIWRIWFENPREYDRASGRITHLAWDHDALCELLAWRIHRKHGFKRLPGTKIDPEDLWKKEFYWSGSFEEFSAEFTRLCVSGPRDIVSLGNMCKAVAGDAPITLAHLAEILPSYSEEKLYGINADFGDVYPRIHHFIELVFPGAPSRASGAEFAEHIVKNTLEQESVNEDFGTERWFRNITNSKLLRLMYEVGLLGIQDGDRVIYSIEEPKRSKNILDEKDLVVHDSFHSILNIDVISSGIV